MTFNIYAFAEIFLGEEKVIFKNTGKLVFNISLGAIYS